MAGKSAVNCACATPLSLRFPRLSAALLERRRRRPVFLGKRNANDFLVVSGVDAAVGKGRMGPDYVAARRGVGRFEQVNPADFLVTQQAEEGDDQVALFIRQKKPVAVFHQEGIRPARLLPAGGLK